MKKGYVYLISGIVSALIAALVSIFAIKLDVLTGIFLGILTCAFVILVARLVYAIVRKEIYDSFIASEVWYAIGVGLFAWLIFNTFAAVQTILVFCIMASATNALGFRFIAEKKEKAMDDEAVVVAPEPTRKEKIQKLAAELRYKFMEDGVTPNLNAPLCVDEDGHHLTPVEADEKGLGALYAEGIEYIKSIVR